MNEVWATLVATVATFVVSFLVMWGSMRARMLELEHRSAKLDEELSRQGELIGKTREGFASELHSLHDTYVGYQHFNEAITMMRDNYKDLKEDMKKILNLLTERG